MTLSTIKSKFMVFLLAILAYFEPTKIALLTVAGLCFSDMILGMIASVKRGEKLSSKRARDTVNKMASYGIAILVSFVIEKELLNNDFPAMKIGLVTISLWELWSMDENFQSINGFSLFKPLINVLKKTRDGTTGKN